MVAEMLFKRFPSTSNNGIVLKRFFFSQKLKYILIIIAGYCRRVAEILFKRLLSTS